jgi:tetratricopeptide (TPR) repeat protein
MPSELTAGRRTEEGNGKARPDRPAAEEELLEAVLQEQRADWISGQRTPVSEWLRRHPELAADTAPAAELAYHEFALRQELGEAPDWDAHRAQFPQYAAALALLRKAEQILDHADDRPGVTHACGARFDGYELMEEVGRGGMGVVYKARQTALDRVVALKVIRLGGESGEPERRRFEGEARAIGRLHHPNIIQIYDVGEADGEPFLSLEFVDGESLARALGGLPWPARRAAELVKTLAEAMHYAHGKGVIHRDLTPANVLLPVSRDPVGSADPALPTGSRLTGGAVAKITDFGLARLAAEGMPHTHSRTVLGTPSYMAPEQAEGKHAEIDARTDVYGLGAILYELLAGRAPFRAATPLETLKQVVEAEPARPTFLNPAVPRDLETICLKCLEKEPARRYASAAELAADLRRFLEGRPVAARPVSGAERLRRWARRNPLPAGLAALLALTVTTGLATGFGLWWSAERHARREAAARREAEENYLSCRELLGEYVSVTRDSRIQSPEARHAQRVALAKAREFCESLRRRRPGDAGLRRDLAGIATALAALDLHDGRLSEAREAAEAARALWQQLSEEVPGDARCRDGLAASLHNLGLVYDRLGRADAAEIALCKAVDLWDQMAVDGALSERAVGHAASARHDLDLLTDHQGRRQDMIRNYEGRYARESRAIASGNTSTGLHLQLLLDLAVLGQAYGNIDRAAAVRFWQRGREVGRALLEEIPENAHANYYLGVCCRGLATAGAAAVPPEETARLFEQAARLFEAQRQRDPSDRANARLLATSYWVLSDCHWQAGRPADALRVSRGAVEVLTSLAERWSADPTARLAVFFSRAQFAELERRCGDPNAARLTARHVADDFERFCADSSPSVSASGLAINGSLAPMLRHAGAPEESLRVARCCLRLAEQLVRTYPDDPRHRAGLSEAWTQLGKTHWGGGRHAEAEAALRAAAAAASDLAERWPEYRPLCDERCRRLGRFLEERGRTGEAAALLPAIR